MARDIDIAECLRRGTIGAVGAIPGTLAAHPCDVVKMRQQVSGLGLAGTLRGIGSISHAYGGVTAGVGQKITTRGPMFLISEFCTQSAQQTFSLSRDAALFVGSAGSGYMTGTLAATFEWRKVQGGTAALASAVATSPALSRRLSVMHGAGLRNAVFDSTFFGCEYQARHRLGLPATLSYALAAALAVTFDFPIDVAVKRMMAAPMAEPPPRGGALGLMSRLLLERRWLVFAGLGAKACEFALSYGVTGFASSYVIALLPTREARS